MGKRLLHATPRRRRTDAPVDIVITARDTQGNESSLTRTLTVVPASGGAAPTAAFSWPTASTTVPAGYPIALGVLAADDSGVVRIELQGLSAEEQALFDARQEARKRRDFAAADVARKSLQERGVVIEDTPKGTRWKRVRT